MTRVTHVLHDAVLRRDKECVAAKLGFPHVCRDQWGVAHAPTALPLLTIEHVKDELRMGVRAPSDMAHMIAVCAFINLKPPTKEMRAAFREYLERVNGSTEQFGWHDDTT